MINLNNEIITNIVQEALAEDIGKCDATTEAIIDDNLKCKANIIAKEDLYLSGSILAKMAFLLLDKNAIFSPIKNDEDFCKKGDVLCTIEGKAKAILSAERVALNYLQRLSGITTLTREYVNALENDRIKILDTRKTTPHLRHLEKYAVRCGKGVNHRIGLFDRIMIKDNHRALASLLGPDGIARSVKQCREKFPDLLVEVEADNLNEVLQAVNANADYILLDNMTNEEIQEAITINDNKCLLEVSGNMSVKRVRELKDYQIDFISVGAITHSARAVDISLEISI